jgi:hypothetical protein
MTHITLWPLPPMTVEEAVRLGLMDVGGVRMGAYGAAARAQAMEEARKEAYVDAIRKLN